jgi:uncharacterized protein (PEP-CTERM system associated)
VLAVVVLTGSTGVVAQNWRVGGSAGITETYTNNVNYAPQGETTSDLVTSLSAALTIHGEGKRIKLNGTLGATANINARETQNNSIAPNVSLFGSVEAIDDFLFVDASAQASTSFLSPFGPQPAGNVNATGNRYVSQNYTVSPYIKGVLGSSNVQYQVRDENAWTVASSYGDSSNKVPNTYSNHFSASLSSAANPLGWTAAYTRDYYDNGIAGSASGDAGASTLQTARGTIGYQVDPQFAVAGRFGYEKNDFPDARGASYDGTIYGAGLQWNPTDRTAVTGFWEHRFFGSSFSWQLSHRLPNSALSASFARGLSSDPQLALAIPAGTTVAQIVDAAFATRIQDPVARQIAVEQFLAKTGLPPTLAAPVNFYTTSVQLQTSQSLSYVIIGVRNAITFRVFNTRSESVSGSSDVLPPELQLFENNTQTGFGLSYSHQLTSFTSFGANASYSRTRSNDPNSSDIRSNNGDFSVNLATKFGPKTSGSAGLTYSLFRPAGTSNAASTDAFTVFASLNHTF